MSPCGERVRRKEASTLGSMPEKREWSGTSVSSTGDLDDKWESEEASLAGRTLRPAVERFLVS